MQKIISFLQTDIWKLNADTLPTWQSYCIKYLKILMLASEGFIRDLCTLRASALTLYTMLSIVPVIAMLFGIAKGFGFENRLKEQIIEQIPQQETMMLQLMEFAETMLATTKGGLVAGIGLAVLFFTVIKVISNIEQSFNHIWKISKGRPMGRKISDYLSLMLLAPLLLIISSSITVFVKSTLSGLSGAFEIIDYGTSLALNLLGYSSWMIMCILFAITLIFMPNTKVGIKSGVIAGIITGTLYQMVQWIYISLQIGVTSYNAIYGSFAALPLFVVWIQMAWLIVLFGCEFAYFHQNIAHFRHKDLYTDINFSTQKALALQIAHTVVKRFTNNESALSANNIADTLEMPISIVQPITGILEKSGILVEIKVDEQEDPMYQPAVDPSLLTVRYVIDGLENRGSNNLPEIAGIQPFVSINEQFRQLLANSKENYLLKEM